MPAVNNSNNPVYQSNRFILRQTLVGQNATILFIINNGDMVMAYDHDAVYQAMCNHYNLLETKSWKEHKYYTNTRNLPAKVRDLAMTKAEDLGPLFARAIKTGRQEAKNITEGREAAAILQDEIAELLVRAAQDQVTTEVIETEIVTEAVLETEEAAV